MAKEMKLEPMTNAHFKCMAWFYKFTDLIWNPLRHFKNIPLKKE